MENKIPEEIKRWMALTDKLIVERDLFFEHGISVARERDDLKEALTNLLKSFRKFDGSETYVEVSEGLTQYNIRRAYEVLNKYNPRKTE